MKESVVKYIKPRKKGLFKSYGYQYACLDNIEYSMFPIGFGDEGAKNPIYCDEEQIALVKKKAVITDDMHDFEIIVKIPILLRMDMLPQLDLTVVEVH